MQYSVFGFDQKKVLELTDGKQSIDERDLMILRWFMRFYWGGMEKRVINGAEYGWVNAAHVCEELPIMRMNPEALRRRLKKMVKFGLFDCETVKNKEVGTRAYYRPTEKTVLLQSDTRTTSKCDGGTTSKCYPVPLQSSNKDSTTNDASTNDQKREKRKPRKQFVPPTFEEVEAYAQSRNSSVDPKRFFDYFAAGDWHDSKGNQVRNWKQKLITWESKSNGGYQQQKKEVEIDEQYKGLF